ncbi:hypothetical protein QBC35DRAFT_449103 [Podospora australis]|uniref:Amidohydrolase-related domain-containing protein n=1 Tax=Podospora australis TaxID=1536484 RepID=A0AAN6X222_9PEZI|nr:hypothetical protein QBC35DRAFT_449103 [Podospora australis]
MAPHPIIDSHIHLWPKPEVPHHNWYTPDNPLATQNSLEEFRAATSFLSSSGELKGFIVIEADRTTPTPEDWTHPLEEVSWWSRIANGQPRNGEGHSASDSSLLLGAIPWAPLVLGPEQVEKYLTQAEDAAGPELWKRVKGFRYLLQDKPNGTGLTQEFIDSLKLLGKKGYIFDAGVDQHRRGRIQLEELVEIIDRAHEGVENEEEKVVFILNHLCKPDLSILSQTDPAFIAWRSAMFTLGKCNKTYMKLSGMFEEMPDSLQVRPADEILSAILPWLAVLLAAFGPSRIMFASNWPVCTVGVGEDVAWKKWHQIVEKVCDFAGLTEEDQAMLWGGTAKKAYNLD